MLPLSHQQRYEAFKHVLGQMHESLALQDDAELMLKSKATALQQFFREQVLSLQTGGLSPETQQWVQSYHVEIDKQLRLLGMDIVFLQAARQAVTAEQRQQQVRDRLATLERYCNALLGEGEE